MREREATSIDICWILSCSLWLRCMSLHCSQLLCFFTTFFKFLNFLISDRWKIEVPCASMRSAGVLPYSEPGQLNSNLHAIWKFNTLLLLRVEGPFGMEYFHGKSKGNKNRGKFPENSVWIKGFSNTVAGFSFQRKKKIQSELRFSLPSRSTRQPRCLDIG